MRSAVLFLAMLALAACGPSNLYECRMEAAKMPTDRGVAVANLACAAKFPSQPAE